MCMWLSHELRLKANSLSFFRVWRYYISVPNREIITSEKGIVASFDVNLTMYLCESNEMVFDFSTLLFHFYSSSLILCNHQQVQELSSFNMQLLLSPFLGTFGMIPVEIRLIIWEYLFYAIRTQRVRYTFHKKTPYPFFAPVETSTMRFRPIYSATPSSMSY